jgi:hypothetical protein
VSPYSFLAGYQSTNANAVIEKLGFDSSISTSLYTGRDITQGSLPDDISDKETLPSILFLNLDAIYNLFTFHFEHLKSWIDVVDKIVIDEVHTIFSELSFRDKYKVYSRLPVLGIPIVALSGSVPKFVVSKFAKRLCLSVETDLQDIKVIHGDDIIGDFPKGFRIKFSVASTYVNKVALSLSDVWVLNQVLVVVLFMYLLPRRLMGIICLTFSLPGVIASLFRPDTKRQELNEVASKWAKGEFDA